MWSIASVNVLLLDKKLGRQKVGSAAPHTNLQVELRSCVKPNVPPQQRKGRATEKRKKFFCEKNRHQPVTSLLPRLVMGVNDQLGWGENAVKPP